MTKLLEVQAEETVTSEDVDAGWANPYAVPFIDVVPGLGCLGYN